MRMPITWRRYHKSIIQTPLLSWWNETRVPFCWCPNPPSVNKSENCARTYALDPSFTALCCALSHFPLSRLQYFQLIYSCRKRFWWENTRQNWRGNHQMTTHPSPRLKPSRQRYWDLYKRVHRVLIFIFTFLLCSDRAAAGFCDPQLPCGAQRVRENERRNCLQLTVTCVAELNLFRVQVLKSIKKHDKKFPSSQLGRAMVLPPLILSCSLLLYISLCTNWFFCVHRYPRCLPCLSSKCEDFKLLT